MQKKRNCEILFTILREIFQLLEHIENEYPEASELTRISVNAELENLSKIITAKKTIINDEEKNKYLKGLILNIDKVLDHFGYNITIKI